jgi:3-methylcrotonyl-CoA carboxylase alpha subunit
MLKKLLIANRGEIACRIIRTARRMGIAIVAVYSDADAKAMHVRAADEAVHIGSSPATESYLVIEKIIAAAKATGADAIHPGYGFLSENADLPEACAKAGIKFVGPSASAMRALGGKAAAKDIAIKAGVPVVPGYQGAAQDLKTLKAEAKRIAYPVMIKAVAGGGGRGMRLVEADADFEGLLDSAQREAKSAFGNADVLVEKFVVAPRHIEVQVFGDTHGNVVHLFERDCTLQRRNQKVIEEAPAPGMSPELREKICGAAVKLAKSVGYAGAGTVEFLVEGGKLVSDAPWYFIEMNTRLQVEHPVTEEITGLDLVEWQLRVAAGEKLPKRQSDIRMHGHAIEGRLCAEDPAKGFMPSIGRIDLFDPPEIEGLRLETGVETGSEISPFYDSMIAKLIGIGPDRQTAIDRLTAGLEELEILGPKTNAAFLDRLLDHSDVVDGIMDTGFIGRELERLTSVDADEYKRGVGDAVAQLLATRRSPPSNDPWSSMDAFQLGPQRSHKVPVIVDGAACTMAIAWTEPEFISVDGMGPHHVGGNVFSTFAGGRAYAYAENVRYAVEWPTYDINDIADGSSQDVIRAPINGRLAKIFVAEGDKIVKGDKVAVVEAMKMEHVLLAARDGTIAKISAKEGAQVTLGTLIAALVEV